MNFKIFANIPRVVSLLGTVLGGLPASQPTAQADQYGDFGYTVSGNAVTITNYTGSAGAIDIPNAIPINSVEVPVTSIGGFSFYGNTVVTSVTLPSSLSSIGGAAFYSCTNLASITLPQSLTDIEDNAFEMCYRLGSITLPAGITNIGTGVFDGCSSLGRIFIPEGITNIPSFAFAYCSGLTNITISKNVTAIGWWAFGVCPKLSTVFFAGDAPTVGANVFQNDTNTSVYYLPGTVGWGTTLDTAPAMLWNPLCQNPAVGNRQFGFNITGTTNIPIVVEGSTNVADGIWTVLQRSTLTNGSIHFQDTVRTDYGARFYRIRSP